MIVNNAGNFALATVEATEPEAFRAAIDVNLVAPFVLAHAFLAEMRARNERHIVTIGSIADRVAFAESGAYAASKFGLRALHEVLRAELRGSGVRATLVSPGPVDTTLWDSVDTETRPGFTPRAQMLSARRRRSGPLCALSARRRQRRRTAAVPELAGSCSFRSSTSSAAFGRTPTPGSSRPSSEPMSVSSSKARSAARLCLAEYPIRSGVVYFTDRAMAAPPTEPRESGRACAWPPRSI